MITFLLTILFFMPNGDLIPEKSKVQVPECVTVNGVRTEDSTCGVKACVVIGDQTAVKERPGVSFQIICNKAQ